MTRRASADDIDEICTAWPEVEPGNTGSDRPTHEAEVPPALARKYLRDG